MQAWMDALQWPAFVCSVLAAYLVASESERRRNAGFWVFLGSNVLWIAWGVPASAWAVVALQVCLAVMNIRGLKKTQK
ncbi:hypothetical protein [Paracidovorax wautersii]|uniref:Inner membrane protein n=1 Tax=Paracidovorax wautersii TaxID=1177982 RepID=A0ABU1ICJ8_9BURK|nr:hypothetical protein [Paracidovorax wautersii]MDR6214957.1 hypothetical protein [Paracidovorax wautersii]